MPNCWTNFTIGQQPTPAIVQFSVEFSTLREPSFTRNFPHSEPLKNKCSLSMGSQTWKRVQRPEKCIIFTASNTIQVKIGLGTVLEQQHGDQWLPDVYAFRTIKNMHWLSEKHLQYSLHVSFIYGRSVKVQTYHKPLVSIFQKALNNSHPRLQCIRLKVQRYDLPVNHKPGKCMRASDTLSHSILLIQQNQRKWTKLNSTLKFKLLLYKSESGQNPKSYIIWCDDENLKKAHIVWVARMYQAMSSSISTTEPSWQSINTWYWKTNVSLSL